MTQEQIADLVRGLASDLIKEPTEHLKAAEEQRKALATQLDAVVGNVATLVQTALDRILADQSSDIAKQMQSLADAERTYQAHLAELDAIAQQNDATMVAIETSKAAPKSDQTTLAGRHTHLMRVAAKLNAPVN
jgi:DNA repair ATPase RecN